MAEKSQFTKFLQNYEKLTFLRKLKKSSWICLRSVNHHCGSKEHVLKHVLRPYHFHEKIWDWKTFLNFFNFCGVPNHFVESLMNEWSGVPKNWKMGVIREPVGVPNKKRVESLVESPPQKKTSKPGACYSIHPTNSKYNL